jgi:hypothetical protein
MKKLVMLLLVVAFCAFCAQSFARDANDANYAVLVYKVSIAEKNVLIDANLDSQVTNLQSAGLVKSSASFKGYLVLEVAIPTLITVLDTNEDGSGDPDPLKTPKLILNGTNPNTNVKNSQWILSGTDVAIHRLITRETKPKTFGSLEWGDDDELLGVSDANQNSWGVAWGKLVDTALVKGSKAKVGVPKSLKGNGCFSHWISLTDVPFGSVTDGTLSLSLDTSTTQKANAAGADVNTVATELAAK